MGYRTLATFSCCVAVAARVKKHIVRAWGDMKALVLLHMANKIMSSEIWKI